MLGANASAAYWAVGKKRRRTGGGDGGEAGGGSRMRAEESEEDGTISIPFPSFGKMSGANIYAQGNHIFFNDDIDTNTAMALNKELRKLEHSLRVVSLTLEIDEPPAIYLHLTTNGGCIHSAFTVIDTIRKLKVPVFTVVEGFVASAGTLISLAGAVRYMTPNAYMLIHELRSGVWGKMSSLEEEYTNLRKIMDHIVEYYIDRTKLSKRNLEKILAKDLIWNFEECREKGIVELEY